MPDRPLSVNKAAVLKLYRLPSLDETAVLIDTVPRLTSVATRALSYRLHNSKLSFENFYDLINRFFTRYPFFAVFYGLGIWFESFYALACQTASNRDTAFMLLKCGYASENHYPILAAKNF